MRLKDSNPTVQGIVFGFPRVQSGGDCAAVGWLAVGKRQRWVVTPEWVAGGTILHTALQLFPLCVRLTIPSITNPCLLLRMGHDSSMLFKQPFYDK
jgi:hypothetical protein